MKLSRIVHAATASALLMAMQSAHAANITPLDAPAADGTRRHADLGAHPQQSRPQGQARPVNAGPARTNSDRVRSLLRRPSPMPGSALHGRRLPAGATTTAVAVATRTPFGESGRGVANPALQGHITPPGRAQSSARSPQGATPAMPTWAASNAKVALPQNSAARMRSLGGIPARAQGRLAGPFSTKSGSAAALAGTELIRRRQ